MDDVSNGLYYLANLTFKKISFGFSVAGPSCYGMCRFHQLLQKPTI
jgi:hypothetical protein